jgi:hypothetical protein
MKIYNEYNKLLNNCPFCGKNKGGVIQSKKRSGIKRKYYPGYKIICFNCWACTSSYFFIVEAIIAWNRRDGKYE